jgi:hypothetical protein
VTSTVAAASIHSFLMFVPSVFRIGAGWNRFLKRGLASV